MADLEGLVRRYRDLAPAIVKLGRSGGRILIVTHIDADGLTAGATVFASLQRKGANVTLRALPELDNGAIKELEAQMFDYYIFTDLASTLIKELEAAFDGRFLVIDHHQLSEEDMKNTSVVNAWTYGFDGGKEASSSSMAYYFAEAMDPANSDLSVLAVVGAVADRQDVGLGRSLTGLNRAAADQAQAANRLVISKDLIFTGRETRPIHEAIALTSTPYIRGLTGSKDSVLAALHQSGLALKAGGSWRTIASLSPDEKMKVTDLIASMLGSSEGATERLGSLFGEVYTLVLEDSYTPLRDAREFGTLLNACGRMGASGTGVAVCLGNRSDALEAAMSALAEYRGNIYRALEALGTDSSRVESRGSIAFVRGEGVVDQNLLGPLISILTSSAEYKGKVVVGSATSGGSELKISARVGDEFVGNPNLGLIMRDVAESVNGVGGGHTMAAGAKIPASQVGPFMDAVARRVVA